MLGVAGVRVGCGKSEGGGVARVRVGGGRSEGGVWAGCAGM